MLECWLGYLYGVRCRLGYCSADATATHCLYLHRNPDWFLPFWYRFTQVFLEKGPLNVLVACVRACVRAFLCFCVWHLIAIIVGDGVLLGNAHTLNLVDTALFCLAFEDSDSVDPYKLSRLFLCGDAASRLLITVILIDS